MDRLSARERSVPLSYAIGFSRKVIAKQLNMAASTVKNHLSNSYRKLGIQGRAELLSIVKRGADTSLVP